MSKQASITTDPSMPCHLIDGEIAVSPLYRCPDCGRYMGRMYRRDTLARSGDTVAVVSTYSCLGEDCGHTHAETGPCFAATIIRPDVLEVVS